jgi:hypothetical protein
MKIRGSIQCETKNDVKVVYAGEIEENAAFITVIIYEVPNLNLDQKAECYERYIKIGQNCFLTRYGWNYLIFTCNSST